MGVCVCVCVQQNTCISNGGASDFNSMYIVVPTHTKTRGIPGMSVPGQRSKSAVISGR